MTTPHATPHVTLRADGTLEWHVDPSTGLPVGPGWAPPTGNFPRRPCWREVPHPSHTYDMRDVQRSWQAACPGRRPSNADALEGRP